MEFQLSSDVFGGCTWKPPESVQEIIRRVEELNLGVAEQYISFIEQVFGLFLLAICQSMNAPHRIGDDSFGILFRFLVHHNNALSTVLKNSGENVVKHELLNLADPFAPDSSQPDKVSEHEKKDPPASGPDDDPERMNKIFQKVFDVKTKKKE